MSNVISSAIFCARNFDKVESQDKIGRVAPAVGQLWKVGEYATDKVTKLDNQLGRSASTAVDALKTAAKQDKLIDGAGKVVKFASKYVNPLICVSSGIDILSADDKDAAFVTNAAALSSMFFVEKQMKTHLDTGLKAAKNLAMETKGVKTVAQRMLTFAAKHKMEGKLLPIVHGVAFVAGSCLAYNLGDKFGHLLIDSKSNA